MIKVICIEIRPALRCCNFCVVFIDKIKSKVQVKIQKSNLTLVINCQKFQIDLPNFIAEPLTVTNFKSTSKFITFRVQVECNFKFESPPVPKTKPPEFGREKVHIVCQCHNSLTSETLFERILPLPSNEFDFSNMFCHLPDNSLPSNPLKPRLSDCLYSDDFIVISSELLIGCVKNGKFLKCKRCLTTVGFYSNDSVKFWRSSIKLPLCNLSLLEHLKNLIWKTISNAFSIFPKILLECEENNCCLLIIVVDKNLVISTSGADLKLKNSEVVKLKFKFYSSCDSQIKCLKDDPFHSLHHFQVHKKMLDFSGQFLITNSKTIPSVFNSADDGCMVYLNLSE